MNFCMRCGAALDPGARFCASCGSPVQLGGAAPTGGQAPEAPYGSSQSSIYAGGPAYPPQYGGQAQSVYPGGLPEGPPPTWSARSVPPQVWLIAALLAVGAGFILDPSIRVIADSVSGLGGKGIEVAFVLLIVVLTLIVASFGVALLAVAWLLVRGDRVGRVLTFALTGAILLGEVLSHPHATSQYIVIAVCIGIDVVLAIPNANAFFRARDARPTGVVAAVVLIGFFAWDFALFGTALLPLYHYDHKDLPLGAGMIATSVGLLALNHNLSRGLQWARITATVLLAVVGVLVLIAEHGQLSAVILAVLAGGTIGLLWGSLAANAYFRPGGAMWTRRAWGPTQMVVAGLAAACLVGVAIIGVRANQTPSYGDFGLSSGYTDPNSVPPSDPTPVNPAPVNDTGYAYTWTFDESTNGDTGTATLDVGNPEQYSDGLTSGDDTLGACDDSIDTSEAAVIPFRLELQNDPASTSDETLGLDLQGIGDSSIPGITGPGLYVDASYTDGSDCNGTDGQTDWGTYSSDSLSPGNFSTTYGFFVITDYYGGSGSTSQEILNDTTLTVSPSQSFDNDSYEVNVNDASGPGLSGDDYNGWTFTLAGDSTGY